MASAVLQGRTNVPAISAMGRHVGLLLKRDVDNDLSAGWGKRAFVEVAVAVEAGAC